MTKIPIPEVIEFQGWHEWNNACESMDDMADFAVANARRELALIPFFDNPTGNGVGQRRILLGGRGAADTEIHHHSVPLQAL